MNLVLAVTWVARPGEEEKVEEILRNLGAESRSEPGCLRFDVNRAADEPRRFLLYEIYEDRAAFDRHNETEHFKRWVLGEAIPRLESRERAYYQPLE